MDKVRELKYQRAELLAQLFLQDLGATVWATGDKGPFDAIAVFRTADKFRLIAAEIKSTEQHQGKEFRFQAHRAAIHALQHSNIPVLFLIADVKNNEMFFGWASEIRAEEDRAKARSAVRCTLPVVSATEQKEHLLDTIFSQPDFSEQVAAR